MLPNPDMVVVQQRLQDEFNLQPHPDKVDFINHLALKINDLIVSDFPGLVTILYRLDIDEQQLREMLVKYEYEDAGFIIAQLIIDREMKKAESRKNYRSDDSIAPEDKW